MNMSYCKYQNTLAALRQIANEEDGDLSREEKYAKERLCELMTDLVNDADFNPYFDDEDDD
jgi:hypothetical protein